MEFEFVELGQYEDVSIKSIKRGYSIENKIML